VDFGVGRVLGLFTVKEDLTILWPSYILANIIFLTKLMKEVFCFIKDIVGVLTNASSSWFSFFLSISIFFKLSFPFKLLEAISKNSHFYLFPVNLSLCCLPK
jgi:hypothetical protein